MDQTEKKQWKAYINQDRYKSRNQSDKVPDSVSGTAKAKPQEYKEAKELKQTLQETPAFLKEE